MSRIQGNEINPCEFFKETNQNPHMVGYCMKKKRLFMVIECDTCKIVENTLEKYLK